MSIDNEFSPENPDREDSLPEDWTPDSPHNIFSTAIAEIRSGQASSLKPLEAKNALDRQKKMDPGLLVPVFRKTQNFLEKAEEFAGESVVGEKEKTEALFSMFTDDINEGAPGDNLTTPLNIQILRLGALVYVGATQESVSDPKAAEIKEVTELFRQIGETDLNDREKKIVEMLSMGIEKGYGEKAGDKFRELMENIKEGIKERTEAPAQMGDDFLEALLVTKF